MSDVQVLQLLDSLTLANQLLTGIIFFLGCIVGVLLLRILFDGVKK